MNKAYDTPLISLKKFDTEEIMDTSSGAVVIPGGSVEIVPVPDKGTHDILD